MVLFPCTVCLVFLFVGHDACDGLVGGSVPDSIKFLQLAFEVLEYDGFNPRGTSMNSPTPEQGRDEPEYEAPGPT